MRPRLLLIIALLATSGVTPAWAQAEGQDARPHRMTVIAPSSGDLLRSSPESQSSSPLPSAPLPRPATVGALLNPLSGQAPQCRTRCADTRYTCLAQDGDGLECNTNWNRCVLGCGGASYRYSSTSPQVFTEDFAPR